MKKIYLCGPITGHPNYEKHFLENEKRILEKAGGLQIQTENPARFPVKEECWEICMRYCLKIMLSCDGIALLQGWEQSRGSRMELMTAGELKIPVVYLEPPVDASTLALLFEAPVHSDIPRYYERSFARLRQSGMDDHLQEDVALRETCTRYLDPHGFEYIDRA